MINIQLGKFFWPIHDRLITIIIIIIYLFIYYYYYCVCVCVCEIV